MHKNLRHRWSRAQGPVESSVCPFQLEGGETWQVALNFRARGSRARAHPCKASEKETHVSLFLTLSLH